MFPQRSHITRKRTVYYYRRRLPSGIGGEVTVSLRTRNFREAQWLAASLDQYFLTVCMNVKSETPAADVARVVAAWLRRRLAGDMEMRAEAAHTGVYFKGRPDPGKTYQQLDLEWVENELATVKAQLYGRLYDDQRPLIEDMMADNGIPSETRNMFAHELFRAHVKLWETIRERTLGEFEPINVEAAPPPREASDLEPRRPAPLLSAALPAFLELMTSQQGWRGQTLAQNTATYRMFIEVVGDKPIQDYQRTDLTLFYDTLRKLPALYSKSASWKGLSLLQIASASAEDSGSRLTMKTVKRHFSALGRLFGYFRRRGEYVGENPAYGFEFPDKRRDKEKRQMWDGEPMTKLFSSPVWSGCLAEDQRSKPGSLIIKDEKYWLPLLAVYHGSRLEESAQLVRSDLRSENGIWYLDINDDDLKQIKNAQSRRRVPIHPAITTLGFLNYIDQIAPGESDRIFPNLRPGGADRKLGHSFTKWYSRYRKAIGLYQPGLDYHSLRHSVTTKLASAGVALEIRNELLGREGKSVDERIYLKRLPLPMLAEAVSKIDWPELAHLKP